MTASLAEETPHGRRFEPAAPPGPSIASLDLKRAIAQLPEGCRAAFVLHDVEGLEHQEVADLLGIAEGTSKSQVHKARRRLRQALQQTARPPHPPGRAADAPARIVVMSCDRFEGAVGDPVDGTIDDAGRAALDAHLAEYEACRSLVTDLRQIRERAAHLDRLMPPNRVWTAIQARLRADDAAAALAWSIVSWQWLAAAAVLVLVAGSTLWMVPSLTSLDPASPDATTAAADAPEANIESVEAEMRLAEEHYENAITGLEQIAQIAAIDDQLLDPDITATLRKNLGVIDQAIAESRAAVRDEPANQVARESLFDVMWRKVSLLQDTIALVNEMREGNENGTARIVEGINRH